MKELITVICLLLCSVEASSQQSNIVPSHSKAMFTVKNLGVKVKGEIRGMYGEMRLNQDSSFMQIMLDIRAIRTGIKLRDQHLREPRFFDEKMYPTMSFTSTVVSETTDGFVTTGVLKIKDVAREIEVPFVENDGNYTGAFSINRKDFNIDNDEFITKGIADEVEIYVTIKLDPAL